MIIISFLKILYSKSKNYVSVWSFLISKIDLKEKTTVSIFEVSTQTKIPLKTLYRILSFGFDYLYKNGFDYVFYLEKNQIIIHLKSSVENDPIILNKLQKKNQRIQKDPTAISPKKPTKKNPRQSKNINIDLVDIILNYLNSKTNKHFKSNNKNTCELINERLLEGFTLENFYYVIDQKTEQWLDTKYEPSLRPQTLFGANMESYINEKPIVINKTQIQKTYEAANSAKQYFKSKD